MSKCIKRAVVVTMMVASWSWSVAMAAPPLLGWGVYLPESNGMRYL